MTGVSEREPRLVRQLASGYAPGGTRWTRIARTPVTGVLRDASAGTIRANGLLDPVAVWSHAQRPFAPILRQHRRSPKSSVLQAIMGLRRHGRRSQSFMVRKGSTVRVR